MIPLIQVVDWLREPALQILPPRLDSPPVVARTPPSAAPRPLAVSEPRVAMRPPSSPAPTPATPSSEAVRLRKQRLIETARAQFLLKAAHS